MLCQKNKICLYERVLFLLRLKASAEHRGCGWPGLTLDSDAPQFYDLAKSPASLCLDEVEAMADIFVSTRGVDTCAVSTMSRAPQQSSHWLFHQN